MAEQERQHEVAVGKLPHSGSSSQLHDQLGGLEHLGRDDQRLRSLEAAWTVANETGVSRPESAGPAAPAPSARAADAFGDSFAHLLSKRALGRLFDRLDSGRTGCIGLTEIKEAIRHLDENYDLGLGANHAQLLLCYIAGDEAEKASREDFVARVLDVATSLQRLRLAGLDLEQLKVVLLAAFKHFDADGNGKLSAEELSVAAESMRLDLQPEDAQRLLRLLTGVDCGLHHGHFEPPLWEQWQSALSGAMEQLGEKKGVPAVGSLIERIRESLEAPGNLLEKVQRCVTTTLDSTEELQQALELAVGANCASTAIQMLMQAGSSDQLSFSDLASLMIFVGLGAVYTKKEFEEALPRDMTEKEALLFAQVFKIHGFSQAEFRTLLSCPSFQWQTAEAGTVLNPRGDCSLKLVVSGRAELIQAGAEGGAGCELLPHFTIGEEHLLCGRQRLWDKDIVRVVEPAILVSWDSEQLQEALAHNEGLAFKMRGLLANSMTRNICILKMLHSQGLGAESQRCSSPCECKGEEECLKDCLQIFNCEVSLEDLRGMLQQESFSVADVRPWAALLSDRVRMGPAEENGDRLFTYLDAEGRGVVSRTECVARMCVLGQIVACLDGMTLRELLTVISCSSRESDLEGDGAHGPIELLATTQALGLAVDGQQALALHAYFDSAADSSDEEELPEVSKQFSDEVTKRLSDGVTAVCGKLLTEADRRGLRGFGFWIGRIGKILDGPGSFCTKARRAQAAVWHGMDALLEGTSCSVDLFGMGFSLWNLWGYLGCPANCVGGGDADVAMLLLSSSLCGLSMARRALEEDQAPGLSVHDALVYALVFEQEGLTVAEFRRLLQGGGARWEHLGEGRLRHAAVHSSLMIVAKGDCQVTFSFGASTMEANVGAGGFLGAHHFFDPERDPRSSPGGRSTEVLVTKPVTALVWDTAALKATLDTAPDLKAKVHRVVTGSLADALLGADLCAAA